MPDFSFRMHQIQFPLRSSRRSPDPLARFWGRERGKRDKREGERKEKGRGKGKGWKGAKGREGLGLGFSLHTYTGGLDTTDLAGIMTMYCCKPKCEMTSLRHCGIL